MAKGMGKRAYHKQDMNQVKRKALIIGSVLAVACLLVIIISFLN